MSQFDESNYFGCISTIIKATALIVICYIAISLFYNTPSSDKVRSEYVTFSGQLEKVDISNIKLLEQQGSVHLNTLGAVVSEVWTMSCSYVKSVFQQRLKSDPSSPKSLFIPQGCPVDEKSVCSSIGGYGMRLHPIKKRFIKHKGVDIACVKGTPIYATADGVVEVSEQGHPTQGYGQMILLKHGEQYKSRYAHLSHRIVKAGETVRRGQTIGLVGSTGGSTGPHLHYEVLIDGVDVDPVTYINLN